MATALDANADVIFTLDDDDLLNLSGDYVTGDGNPLSIIHPRWTYQSEYLSSLEGKSASEDDENS